MAWNLIKTVIDPLSQTKAQMLRGDEMDAYFRDFLTPEQAAFMSETLGMRARPTRDAFAPIITRLRRSLGCAARTNPNDPVDMRAPSPP